MNKYTRLKKFKKENRQKETFPQEILKLVLFRMRSIYNFKVRREYIIYPFIIDLYIPQLALAIEVDGGYHKTRIEYDSKRDSYLRNIGIDILRFENETIEDHLDEVIKCIENCINIRRIKDWSFVQRNVQKLNSEAMNTSLRKPFTQSKTVNEVATSKLKGNSRRDNGTITCLPRLDKSADCVYPKA